MFRIICLVILNFCSVHSYGQLKFALKIMEDLTSSEMHGRGYVNNGDAIASEYIGKQYAVLGAKPLGKTYFQEFSFPVNSFPDTMRVTIDGKNLIPGIDYIVDPASPGVNASYDVIYCKGWSVFDSLRENSSGNNILFVMDPGGIKDKDSLKKLTQVQMEISKKFPLVKLNETKLTWSVATDLKPFPALEILKEKWPAGAKKISIHIRNQFINSHQARNVVGYIQGKKRKKEFIVFTAHYDHLGRMGDATFFPGANDNASGVAQLLNLMKYYSENPPEYTMVFIAFAGEEAGLLGSRYFTEHPLFKLDKIKFLINLDIMGTGEDGITVVNGTKHKQEFEKLKQLNEENDFLKVVKERGEAANSDHYFFSQKGVPAFFIYTLGGSKAYHDVNDIMSGLSFSEFEDISSLLIKFAESF